MPLAATRFGRHQQRHGRHRVVRVNSQHIYNHRRHQSDFGMRGDVPDPHVGGSMPRRVDHLLDAMLRAIKQPPRQEEAVVEAVVDEDGNEVVDKRDEPLALVTRPFVRRRVTSAGR